MTKNFIFLMLLFVGTLSFAQKGPAGIKRGLILSKQDSVVGNGKGVVPTAVLDPNGDGWITDRTNPVVFNSTTFYPFSTGIAHEITEFELPFSSAWQAMREPTSDLQTGSNCGQSEIVDNANGDYSGGYYYYDTVTAGGPYLLFRIRLANDATGAFGFSFFMDTDIKFGSTGANADPNAVVGNRGFEYEILYATGAGGGVQVRWVDGVAAANQQTTLASYAQGVRNMRSWAVKTNCPVSNIPVFYDFYINLSDLNITTGAKPAGAPVITGNTPFRLGFATASSPGSGLGGSASDIGGIDDATAADDDALFNSVITPQPPHSFKDGDLTDSDSDGVPDGSDLDDDNDGITDIDEGGELADTDKDGIANKLDLDSDNDGMADVTEAGGSDPDNNGIVGSGASNTITVNAEGIPAEANSGAGYVATNSDTDANKDFLDIDSDNDGIVDVIESQYTTAYVAPTGVDADGDGIDNAFDADLGGEFLKLPADTDGDAAPDYKDLDSDADGLTDMAEAAQGTYAAADADGDGLADVFDDFNTLAAPVTPAGTNADNNGQTATSPFPNSGAALNRTESNWRDYYVIWYDCATAKWYDNAGAYTPDDVTDLTKDLYIPDCGGTPVILTSPVTKRRIFIPTGGNFGTTSCLEVVDFVSNKGIFRLIATTETSYGQYLGPATENVEFTMVLDENGWHTIGFPVHITAAEFAAQNNTITDMLVRLDGNPNTDNLWWYDSEMSSGKEQGFFVERNGVQYYTHVYGTWNLADSTMVLGERAFNYYIDQNIASTTRVIKAKGTTHDEIIEVVTNDNFGGFNLIPNTYPVTLSVQEMYSQGFFGSNFDNVVWIWDADDAYQTSLPGQFSKGAYVAVDAQTGLTLNSALFCYATKNCAFPEFLD